MISVQAHKDDLHDRIATVTRLLDATCAGTGGGVSREARGLAVLLLFAAYENLLTSLTRTLLEGAVRCGVGVRRLRPGFRMFAVAGKVASLRHTSSKKVYVSALPALVEAMESAARPARIDTDEFPMDGSYFRRSQIQVWCRTFGIANPEKILAKVWLRIDAIVSERNGVAHGRLTPEEVGRNYSEADIRLLVANWEEAWLCFLSTVGQLASSRDFFRTPR